MLNPATRLELIKESGRKSCFQKNFMARKKHLQAEDILSIYLKLGKYATLVADIWHHIDSKARLFF